MQTASEAVSSEAGVVVEGPYDVTPMRSFAVFLGVISVLFTLCSVAVLFVVDSAIGRALFSVVAITFGGLGYLSFSAPHRGNRWQFDDHRWAESDPINGRTREIEWQRVRRVRFLQVEHARFIVVDLSDGQSENVALGLLRPRMEAELARQFCRYVAPDLVDSEVLALSGGA